MATVLLSAAGSAIGGSIGGSVLGLSAAAIGQAAGAVAGSLIDQTILGQGSRAVDVGRARSLRIQSSTEGAAIPQVFGRMRLAGQLIWSSRYRETVRETRQGGKATGGQRVREFSYSISFAVGLCEGPIDRIGRVWADGRLLDTSRIEMRVYHGTAMQTPDPKIEAVEGAGNVPAYRGLAYVVFEELPVGDFGNRIPQLNFEVFRSVRAPGVEADPEEAGEPLRELVQAVALSPGTGEFALETEPVRHVFRGGAVQYANVNNAEARPDLLVSLDQLEGDLPGCEAVSLIVSWFGDDLRCGRCRVEPRIEERGRQSKPYGWSSAGLTTATAPLVSQSPEGRPNFGGSPSDRSIIRAIRELNARGKKVLLYPFLLMDIPAGNTLEDPYTGAAGQPVFPWRGRITLEKAPGVAGSADQTAAAAGEVAAFFGSAAAGDFSVAGESVGYAGPDEWSWRRFVLHLAALAQAAGGVEAICVGTEMRGLTQIRSARTAYPAVEELRSLAGEVRALLPAAKISYAADWSEYFGHQPGDGSGDVIFHLDPLWSDPNIDFVGIDDYTSLSDWRHEPDHLDAAAGHRSVYSLPYLESNIEGGENYDWYYADEAARALQTRTQIVDGAHGEHWVFRPKDIRGWWSNPHHNRIGGVRQAASTGWVPESKPVWLTETGCPAVDLGANKPNLFFDGRSSESGLPPGSRGARDDEMQRRFLQAKLGYWGGAENPVSGVYGGPMIPPERIYVWTWDARPWPDFPVRESLWADGPSHRLGHWITGRVSAGALADVVAEICARSGVTEIDVSGLYGTVHGYLIDETRSAREALQPLMLAYGFDAFESGGRVVFRMRDGRAGLTLALDRLAERGAPGEELELAAELDPAETDVVRLSYVQAETDYRIGSSEARRPDAALIRISESSLPLALPGSAAQAIAERWLAEADRARETAAFALPPSLLAVEPGDVVAFDTGAAGAWRVERVTDALAREVEAVRVEPGLYLPKKTAERSVEPALRRPPGPVEAVFLNLPLADGGTGDHRPLIAVTADPWPGEVAVYASDGEDGFEPLGTVRKPALTGVLESTLPPASPGLWQRAEVVVAMPKAPLASATRLGVLNGANRIAVEAGPDAWEILQFRDAELIAPGTFRLAHLLRGQRGTEALAGAAIAPGARVVVLDDALFEVPLTLDAVGLARNYRVGPASFDVGHESFVALTATALGLGLRPFAPASLRARRDPGSGDLAVSWIRRTRIGGDSWHLADVPLAEEAERYRLRILAGGTELRVAETDTPGFVYDAAMQAADGAGSVLELRVAQFSSTFGFGPEEVLIHDG